jgi:photosynthetic reaction center cytochrome c subunit
MQMNEKCKSAVLAGIALTGILAVARTAMSAQSARSAPAAKTAPANAPKTTEQVYKNIKVLTGVPADQLIPAMQFITGSLGVGCNFCHVEGHFDQDDKKPKEIARKMMTMMFAINKDNFAGHRQVTCNSCHNGSPKPASIPVVADETVKPMAVAAIEEAPDSEKVDLSKLPTASDVVDKYVQAIGGAAAIEKISSRLGKGTVSGFGGRKFPVDLVNESPDKSAVVTHYPNGDGVVGYNGHQGWTAFPHRPSRDMEGPDLAAAEIDADLHLAIDLKKMFRELKVGPPEKIGDHEAYQIIGSREGQSPVEFYFDEQSGLLLRQVRYAESPLGLYPTRIDYTDYRDQNGVKIPFAWTTARPSGSSTVQLDSVEQNVPVDEAKFARPAPEPNPAPHP